VASGRAGVDLDRVAEGLAACQATVLRLGQPGYPDALAVDHQAPAVLFAKGHLELLDDRARVAIVGTRRCTFYGSEVARQLGSDLGQLGITVVSGLAAGIDAAAHEGALAGSGCHDDDQTIDETHRPVPIGVVGSGLDIIYPSQNARLWGRVANHGLLLSEAPPGAPPEAWRFPARNRIIAALAHVVVVVESHAVGGSMHTVDAARERSGEILAVPGAIRSPASVGTNHLLSEGVGPCRDVVDIVTAINRARPTSAAVQVPAGAGTTMRPPPRNEKAARQQVLAQLGPTASVVLDAVGWEPSNLDQILLRTGLRPGQAGVALEELKGAGVVIESSGWWERAPLKSARTRKAVSTVR
jgi:DNA processing protein